jgi:hypothetical protein
MSSKLIEEIAKDINIINMMMKDIQKKALQLEEQIKPKEEK